MLKEKSKIEDDKLRACLNNIHCVLEQEPTEVIEKVVKEFGVTSDKLDKTFNDIKIPYPSDLMYIEPKTKKK